jgi:IS1 family transposase/transposase-like protein
MTHSSTNARPPCPYCGYSQLLKNGITHHKKQKYLCKVCRRQFIENPTKKYIDSTTKLTIKRLLLEKIPLIGIARSLQISMTWLQKFVNNFYRCIPCQVKPKPKDSLDLVIECDELWSFVRSKENAVYVWLAINRKTQEIVGVYFGDRSRKSAREFWNSLSQEYRQQAKVYTDLWLSYQEVIPPAQHQPSSKKVAKLLEYKDSIIP